jgi:CRP/FNR family transcriptional regulator
MHAVTLRTRRGQTLALTFKSGEAAIIVRSGVLTLHVTMADGLRQVVSILYPGDMLRSAFAPPHAESTLTASSAGEIWRLRWSAVAELATRDSSIARYFEQAVASQMARQAIHLAAIGQFDCEQRVATFLMELALRTGVPASGGGMVFDMPLRRQDVADYLGLNADTLSRTMSRLKAAGLIGRAEGSRTVVYDLHALAALSPAAPSLFAIYGFPEGQSCASPCCTPCTRGCMSRTAEEA